MIILLGIMEFGQFISTSDMQQGSNLGPFLLISFINHLLEMVLLFVLLSFLEKFRFADDLKLFSFIKNFVDCVNLQVHLMLTLSTCERNKLRLNMDKFRIMNFFRKTEIYSYDYDCNGRHIVLRGLGVLFDTELSFVELISRMVLDATGVYGFMVRNCSDSTEVNCFKISYNRVLENASVVWSPVYECHCRKLKGVQRRFMKFLLIDTDGVYTLQGCDNAVLCERTGYSSLEIRRIIASILFLRRVVLTSTFQVITQELYSPNEHPAKKLIT